MKNIFKILALAKPLHKLMALIALCVIVGTCLEIVSPLLSGQILDEVVRQSGSQVKQYDNLIRLLGISLTATIGFLILRSLGQRLGDVLAGRMRQYLTETFYHKVMTLPQSYFDSEISGKI